jgi:hypothetical protein
MKVKVLVILTDGTIIIKNLSDCEELPVEGYEYTVYFEKIEPDPVPEFNT